VDNPPTCVVLGSGDRSAYIRHLDVRDVASTHIMLGSSASAQQIACARASGEVHYLVKFGTTGGPPPSQQAAAERQAIQRRQQELAASAGSADPVHEQLERQHEYFRQAQRLVGQLADARAAATSARQQAARAIEQGEDASEAEKLALLADERVRSIEAAQERQKKPEDLRRAAGNAQQQRQRALDAAIAAEILDRQQEARRRLTAAVYVDGALQIPLATLLAEAAAADEMAEWARYYLRAGTS
jgi:hypothetical protein